MHAGDAGTLKMPSKAPLLVIQGWEPLVIPLSMGTSHGVEPRARCPFGWIMSSFFIFLLSNVP